LSVVDVRSIVPGFVARKKARRLPGFATLSFQSTQSKARTIIQTVRALIFTD
jgi:hypothetical protein